MTLLKIGDRYLNTDRVEEYTVEDSQVIVRFGPNDEIRFARHDALLLRSWLELAAVDLTGDLPHRQDRWADPRVVPARGREPRR